MKQNNKATREEQSPQSVGHKRYVPYGLSGEYYVYDNDAGQIPMGYGNKSGLKKDIQAICDKLNAPAEQVGHTPGERFVNLAELLVQMMVEADEDLTEDFEVSKDTVNKTAAALQTGYENKEYQETEGGLYYSGMIDDYGGLIDAEIEKAKQQVGHTPGEWKILEFRGDRNEISIHNKDGEVMCDVFEMEKEGEQEANAELIVSAVNNTAGKGINPEAVPDLLEALKNLLGDVMDLLNKNDSIKLGTMGTIHIVMAKEAINKATKQ